MTAPLSKEQADDLIRSIREEVAQIAAEREHLAAENARLREALRRAAQCYSCDGEGAIGRHVSEDGKELLGGERGTE